MGKSIIGTEAWSLNDWGYRRCVHVGQCSQGGGSKAKRQARKQQRKARRNNRKRK